MSSEAPEATIWSPSAAVSSAVSLPTKSGSAWCGGASRCESSGTTVATGSCDGVFITPMPSERSGGGRRGGRVRRQVRHGSK
eukprot:4332452-Pleurochrysis_carterae.AAC.1